jgi:amidase
MRLWIWRTRRIESSLTGSPLGPLHGVPISIKVNSDQAGQATTDGIVTLKENVARVDSPQVEKLREAGAVFVGRSNPPTFPTAGSPTTTSMVVLSAPGTPVARWGIERRRELGGRERHDADRPRQRHRRSIRYPAYACGVVGVRPTVGRVPSLHGPTDVDQALSTQSIAVDGHLGRSVTDLRLALDAMSGFDPRDPFTVPVPTAGANEPLPRPIRVGLLRDVGVAAPQPVVGEALEAAGAGVTSRALIAASSELPILNIVTLLVTRIDNPRAAPSALAYARRVVHHPRGRYGALMKCPHATAR